MHLRRLLPALALASLAGCSSILSGTSQEILVNTTPAGADCALYREGIRIATIQGTPASATVQKTKHPIWVVCAKPGSDLATHFNKSGVEGATLGNILLGGGIGWAIDSASGADNKYDSPVNLTLLPAATAVVPLPASGSAMLPSTFHGAPPVAQGSAPATEAAAAPTASPPATTSTDAAAAPPAPR